MSRGTRTTGITKMTGMVILVPLFSPVTLTGITWMSTMTGIIGMTRVTGMTGMTGTTRVTGMTRMTGTTRVTGMTGTTLS